ncbi:hypothetical protein EDB86DRAFT_1607343 [Lactarius hatsudake]|nr:hypothetical protein EDB86DRAFT_1607343 [Lactarius hatsudake]
MHLRRTFVKRAGTIMRLHAVLTLLHSASTYSTASIGVCKVSYEPIPYSPFADGEPTHGVLLVPRCRYTRSF